MALEAVIFDMDGVLSETQRLHAKAQSEVVEKYGGKMKAKEITKRYAGKPPGTFFREESDAEDPMEAYSEKQEELYRLVEEKGVAPVEGSRRLVKELNKKYSLAVASSSEPDFIDMIVEALSLKQYFETLESASDVKYGKPAPDVFLEVARKLDVAPENCLVIEDGRSGMKGAREAGMISLGLVEDDAEYPAHETIRSLETLDAEKLESIYQRHR